jgi:hypothetical protein
MWDSGLSVGMSATTRPAPMSTSTTRCVASDVTATSELLPATKVAACGRWKLPRSTWRDSDFEARSITARRFPGVRSP